MFVIQASSRENGNTEALSKILLDGIPAETVVLREKRILPIVDQRHDAEGFAAVADDYDQVVKQMLAHDQIVIATPLYWYGMSGLAKNFIDRWSQSLRDPQLNFKERMKGKKIFVVVVGGSGARLKALPLIQQLQLICNFVEATFEAYIIGEAARPGEIVNDLIAVELARSWNKRLKA